MVETLLKGDLVDPQIYWPSAGFYWKAHAASDGKRNSLITSEDLAALWKVKNMAGAPVRRPWTATTSWATAVPSPDVRGGRARRRRRSDWHGPAAQWSCIASSRSAPHA